MITTVAVHGYRSLRDVVLELGRVTLVTGANGSGKSSLYRSLALLAGAADGSLVPSLAAQGGLPSVLWAGPEVISQAMRDGEVPVQGKARRVRPVSLMLGFASDELGYLVDVGIPKPEFYSDPLLGSRATMFIQDPEVKREAIFAGPLMRPAGMLLRRKNSRVEVRDQRWRQVADQLDPRLSVLSELADPLTYPELLAVRQRVRGWRFYDGFRTDAEAPARKPQTATWTPVLAGDGGDLAPALQTILESAYADPLVSAVSGAFPGGQVVVREVGTRMELGFQQHGLLRVLAADELSDGTLRYLLLCAALLSPRPPRLLVLNEPETSLHPDVVPALARLICEASRRTQVVVVSHSTALADGLREGLGDELVHHELAKDTGETVLAGRGMFERPLWDWGNR